MRMEQASAHPGNVLKRVLDSPVQQCASVAGGVTNFGLHQMPDIFCIVNGDHAAFPVTFDAAQTVGRLKKAIKAEKSPELNDIAADKLQLYQLDIDELDKTKRNERIKEKLQPNPDP